jgi:hypothetical protein
MVPSGYFPLQHIFTYVNVDMLKPTFRDPMAGNPTCLKFARNPHAMKVFAMPAYEVTARRDLAKAPKAGHFTPASCHGQRGRAIMKAAGTAVKV